MPVVTPVAPTAVKASLTRRTFLTGAIAASAGLALYSNEISRHELEIIPKTFHIARLPPAFDGFRFVQISDIHLSEYTEDFFLEHVIDQVNALNPEMVLLTGDFVSRGPLPISVSVQASARCARLLTRLHCPARYGVLGNHDWTVSSKIIRDDLAAQGTRILVNEHLRLERNGQHLILAGVDDIYNGHPDANLAIPPSPDAPVILMAHEPDYARELLTHPRGRLIDLILSGHTHGGQVRIPGVRPLQLPPLGRIYPEGQYLVGTSQLYVNRGIGTVGLPFRLNCPAEITLITLRPAEA